MREMMMRQQRISRSSKYRLHEMKMTQTSEYCDFHRSIPYSAACTGEVAPDHCRLLMRMSSWVMIGSWLVCVSFALTINSTWDCVGIRKAVKDGLWTGNRMPQDCRGH